MYNNPTDVGPQQMQHFSQQDGFNLFRIPAPWQLFVGNNLEPDQLSLNETFMAEYDTVLGSCLSLGAHCIIDIHNYARWWNQIIDQGGRKFFAKLLRSIVTLSHTSQKAPQDDEADTNSISSRWQQIGRHMDTPGPALCCQ